MKNRLFKRISTAVVAFAMVFCAGVTGVGVPKASAAAYVTSLTSGKFYRICLGNGSFNSMAGYYWYRGAPASPNPLIQATLNRNGIPSGNYVKFKLVKSGSNWKIIPIDKNGQYKLGAVGLDGGSGDENKGLRTYTANDNNTQTFKIVHTGSGKFTIQTYDRSTSAFHRYVTAASLNGSYYTLRQKATKTNESYWYFIPA